MCVRRENKGQLYLAQISECAVCDDQLATWQRAQDTTYAAFREEKAQGCDWNDECTLMHKSSICNFPVAALKLEARTYDKLPFRPIKSKLCKKLTLTVNREIQHLLSYPAFSTRHGTCFSVLIDDIFLDILISFILAVMTP